MHEPGDQYAEKVGLRAVLFDSGGVLIRPIGGRWNPRADFEQTVLAADPSVTPERFAAGIEAGERFFARCASTPDFDDYHRAVLAGLGVAATAELLAELVRPVPASSVLETFAEVPGTLAELRRRGVRMAVVSDAWADLPDLHTELGIGEYFEAYAISQLLGCNKPDPRTYRHASTALGLEPDRCLFIDDDPALVAAAIELGYAGLAMRRDPLAEDGEGGRVGFIRSLTEILALFPPGSAET